MAQLTITDKRLKPIADKVLAGERLSSDDGILLFRSPDLLAVGWLANHVREKRHGDAAERHGCRKEERPTGNDVLGLANVGQDALFGLPGA